ncbi:MAG: phosphoribosyltransferase [Hydrogenophilaceae bacterium]|nr:phosphoribosyltransferase [Hydrogenophilaceae bacterium]
MNKPLRCELVSWSRFAHLARQLAYKIHAAGYQPDLVIAIARGGYAPARVLADYFGVMNVASIKVEHYKGPRQMKKARIRHPLPAHIEGRRVLIVDDVSDTGDTFEVAIPHIRERLPGAEIRTAVLLHKAACPVLPDFWARKVVKWRWIIYPWAVIEDLGNFLRAAQPQPKTIDAFDRMLRTRHQLKVPRCTLQDVLDLAYRPEPLTPALSPKGIGGLRVARRRST